MRNTKFDSKSYKGVMVGYKVNGYKVWVPETEKFTIARDVIVNEITYKNTRPQLTLKEDKTPTSFRDKQSNEMVTIETQKPEVNKSDQLGKLETSESEKNSKHGNQAQQKLENSKDNDQSDNESEVRTSERLSKQPKISYDETTYDDLVSDITSTPYK